MAYESIKKPASTFVPVQKKASESVSPGVMGQRVESSVPQVQEEGVSNTPATDASWLMKSPLFTGQHLLQKYATPVSESSERESEKEADTTDVAVSSTLPVQAKLTIGEPGDRYEQEADRVAADVVSRINSPQSQTVQREEIPADEDELQMKPVSGTIQREEMLGDEEELQMKPMVQRVQDGGGMAASAELEGAIEGARGSGQPLDESVREPMEREFGADFSRVKVHTDAQSDALNQSIQAKAFTTGQDVFFRSGAYDPGSRGGQELIAHELTHVVQQNGGTVMRSLLSPTEATDHRPNWATVIQRQVLSKIQILSTDEEDRSSDGEDQMEEDQSSHEDWIGDVIIGGRTPSPFSGTMGAHSTAWVAHIDAIRRQLINTPLSEGIQYLIAMANEECSSPLLSLESMIGKRHSQKLQESKLALQMQIKAAQDALLETETTKKVQALQKLINAYMTFVNYLPMATVAGGDPSGHGEGSARGDLNVFEYVFANVKQFGDKPLSKDFTKELAQLSSKDDYQKIIKSRGADKFSGEDDTLKPMLIERLWTMFAAETPGVFLEHQGASSLKALKVWYFAIRNFLKTIRAAYPYAYDFTEMHLVENQIVGFKLALANAKYTLDPGLIQRLLSALEGNPISEEAVWREENNEVAQSDFQQSGTGFQATVLLEDDTFIGDVNLVGAVEMIGRTKSPFSGTMGAHSTAWVVHLDAVRRLLIGKTMEKAIAGLKEKSSEALEDPGLQLSSQISEKHQIYLIGAYNMLVKHVAKADKKSKAKSIEQLEFLEQFILDYLSFINFLPLSTVEVGKVPGGRREGEHRTFLLNYEEYGEKMLPPSSDKQAILRQHIWGLYDPSATNAFPPKLGQRETTNFNEHLEEPFTSEHELYKYVFKRKEATVGKNEVAKNRFFHAIQEAYPRSMIDSGLMENKTEKSEKFTIAETEVLKKESKELETLLHQNNCLINAIKKAAFGAAAQVTAEELLAIRMRIGEFGTMLFASGRVINIICDVLGITRGVVVIYTDRPSEDFGDTTNNPVMIRHTGHAHFEPYEKSEIDDEDQSVGERREKRGLSSVDHTYEDFEVSENKRKKK